MYSYSSPDKLQYWLTQPTTKQNQKQSNNFWIRFFSIEIDLKTNRFSAENLRFSLFILVSPWCTLWIFGWFNYVFCFVLFVLFFCFGFTFMLKLMRTNHQITNERKKKQNVIINLINVTKNNNNNGIKVYNGK